VIFLAIFWCLRGRQTPLSVLLALLFAITAGTMAYTVTNFGTLFRLRQMVYVIAAIAPLTVRRRREPAPDESRRNASTSVNETIAPTLTVSGARRTSIASAPAAAANA